MIEFKLTPGPWVVEERDVMEDGSVYPFRVGGKKNLPVCYMEWITSDAPPRVSNWTRSNASLIAAAPDLLGSTRGLLEIIQAAIASGDWKVDGACDPDIEIRRAEAAIAKAAGESA